MEISYSDMYLLRQKKLVATANHRKCLQADIRAERDLL